MCICASDFAPRSLLDGGYFARTLSDINIAQAKVNLDRQMAHHKQCCNLRAIGIY